MAQRRSKPEVKISGAWKAFYQTPEGRVALAALFKDFGFYDTPQGADPILFARSIGQRDVLVHLSQLINMKTETVIQDDGDMEDVLDRVMRSN